MTELPVVNYGENAASGFGGPLPGGMEDLPPSAEDLDPPPEVDPEP